MSEYRFHLQKYRPGSKTTCPSCGKSRCFVRYIDEQGNICFPENVGKCDRENSCGYHYTPKEYFKDNPDVLEMDEGNGKSLLSALISRQIKLRLVLFLRIFHHLMC